MHISAKEVVALSDFSLLLPLPMKECQGGKALDFQMVTSHPVLPGGGVRLKTHCYRQRIFARDAFCRHYVQLK
jgi:hypothetical protein